MHNGSLYLLPFTQDPNGLFFHQFNGGSSGSRGSLHHESRFRCRATNAYGKIVSTVVSVKPGNNRCLTKGMNTCCWGCIFLPLLLRFLGGMIQKKKIVWAYFLAQQYFFFPLFFRISNLIFLIPFHLLTVLICIEKQIRVTSDNLNLV